MKEYEVVLNSGNGGQYALQEDGEIVATGTKTDMEKLKSEREKPVQVLFRMSQEDKAKLDNRADSLDLTMKEVIVAGVMHMLSLPDDMLLRHIEGVSENDS